MTGILSGGVGPICIDALKNKKQKKNAFRSIPYNTPPYKGLTSRIRMNAFDKKRRWGG